MYIPGVQNEPQRKQHKQGNSYITIRLFKNKNRSSIYSFDLNSDLFNRIARKNKLSKPLFATVIEPPKESDSVEVALFDTKLDKRSFELHKASSRTHRDTYFSNMDLVKVITDRYKINNSTKFHASVLSDTVANCLKFGEHTPIAVIHIDLSAPIKEL